MRHPGAHLRVLLDRAIRQWIQAFGLIVDSGASIWPDDMHGRACHHV